MNRDPMKIFSVHQPPIRWWQWGRIHMALLVEASIRQFEREQKKARN